MQPDVGRPGALAGATELDIRTVCTTSCEYNSSLPLSPAAYGLVFLRRFTVRRPTVGSLPAPMKPDTRSRWVGHDLARFDWVAGCIVEGNQIETVPLHIAGGHHAPR